MADQYQSYIILFIFLKNNINKNKNKNKNFLFLLFKSSIFIYLHYVEIPTLLYVLIFLGREICIF